MKPEYSNHITTINHPSFGTLRLIHLDGKDGSRMGQRKREANKG